MLRAYVPIGSSTPLLEGFVEDVTERVKAEAALARERAFLTALMDNVPDYIYFKDRESRFILNNKAHVRELGAKSPADVLGKTDFDFFAPQHAQKAYNDEQQIIRTGQPLVNAVEQEIWTDRPLTWVSSTKMPLLDDKGEIVGTFGISRDMTERRQMEEKNLRLAAMVESSNDAIIGIDLDDIVTSWNKGAEKIFGYAAEEIIGRSINPLLSLEIVNQEPALREKLRSEGHVVGLESTVTRKDGKTVNVSTSISFVTDAGGQIVGITCIARDVTSQRALQAQIIRAQRLESLGTLAAGIAHQFNNINAAVKGYLDVALPGCRPTGRGAHLHRGGPEGCAAGRGHHGPAPGVDQRFPDITGDASPRRGRSRNPRPLRGAAGKRGDLSDDGVPADPAGSRQSAHAGIHRHEPDHKRHAGSHRAPLTVHNRLHAKRSGVLLPRSVGQRPGHLPRESSKGVHAVLYDQGRMGGAGLQPGKDEGRRTEPCSLPEHRGGDRRLDRGGKRARKRSNVSRLAAGSIN